MKTNKGQIHDAGRALLGILDPNRQLLIPQTGKYRLAKMHRFIEPHYVKVNDAQAALVQKYGCEVTPDPAKPENTRWELPPDTANFPAFVADWNVIRDEEIEVSGLETIPLASLGDDARAGLSVFEFRLLGELIDG